MAVLDQEEAKKFLTGKEEDKYAFFTKATELERLDQTYASIADNIDEQKEARERASDALESTKENTKKLKKEWEQFQELDKLEVEVQQVRAMVGWATYKEFNEELENELKNRSKLQKNLDKYKGALEQAEESVNVTDDQEAAATERLEELARESDEAANVKIQMEKELKLAEMPLKEKERDLKIVAKEIGSAKKKLQSARNRLERARKEILDSAGNAAEEERQRTRKIAQLESDIADGRPRVEPLKEKIGEEYDAYKAIEPEKEQKKQLTKDTEKAVSVFLIAFFFYPGNLVLKCDCCSPFRKRSAIENRIRGLQSEAGGGEKSLSMYGHKCTGKLCLCYFTDSALLLFHLDNMYVFHAAMNKLVQNAIKNNKFKGPVAGPVGM